MQTFSEQLVAARKAAGMTQNDLAVAVAVTRQTISSWERGRTVPDIDMIRRLSGILGVDLLKPPETVPEADAHEPPEAEPVAAEPQPEKPHISRRWLIAGAATLVCVAVLLALLVPRFARPSSGGASFDAEYYRQQMPNEAGKAYITFSNKVWVESNGGTEYQMYDFTMLEQNGVGFSITRIDATLVSASGSTRAMTITAEDLAKAVDPHLAPYGTATVEGGFPRGEFTCAGITVYGEDENAKALSFRDLIEF